ncbi:MAG: histidinol dehydrogenase [Candidatus Helarchaeota archaeon]
MLEIISSKEFKEKYLSKVKTRGKISLENVNSVVSKIVNDVRTKGEDALIEYTEQFDGVTLKKENLLVKKEEIEESYRMIDESFLNALRQAKKNIQKFHEAQIRDKWFIETDKGIFVGQIMRPLNRVGLYIPGGRAVYPSTVLMGAVPAKSAGVKEVFLVTPPNKEGKIDPSILIAANESNVDKIFKVGGAQAIAALAYGTKIIDPVDKIIGPGNIYVTAAKMMVSNDVRIDLPAGPSEVLIIADETANSEYITIDLLAQAEHDPDSCCYLLTPSKRISEEVISEINKTYKEYKRREIILKVLENNVYIVIVDDLNEAIQISNEIAPEHLELQVSDSESLLGSIENAGAIFMNENSPVAIGDYIAGSNHVLPTGGLARIYSGLSTLDFVKIIDVIRGTREGLKSIEKSMIMLAKKEGLDAHAKSVSKRLEN